MTRIPPPPHHRRQQRLRPRPAQQALPAGHRVIGTVRSETGPASNFEALPSRRVAFGRLLDVTDAGTIDALTTDIEATSAPPTCWSTTQATATKASSKNPRWTNCAISSK